MWSFQSGTPNPDGLIRLPGRVLNFLVFGATDNVGLGYFYIISSLVIAFVAFFLFARKFLQIKSTSVQVIGALFFALNPIFLGNVAKVGLVLAAAMLPLCLLAIRAAFVQRRFRFFLLYIIFLNLSFLHPFNFTVNLAISGGYLLWMMWKHRAWVFDTWPKFIVVGLFGIAVNLYFALPLYSMGSVSKDIISTNITPVAVDYTSLVGVSNTGDLFTGFSLSKDIFVDFAFYNSTYQNVYFFGVFLFYVLLLGLYLRTEKLLNLVDKRRLGIFLAGFLVFLLLAATTVAHVDTIIKFLIGLPGGWAFRSPLKWQLYIPLVLFAILVILLNRVPSRLRLWSFHGGLLLTFLIMNGYILADMTNKILTPRSPKVFAALAEKNMDGKTALFVNNGKCMEFMRNNPWITTEMNQIFASKNTQLKHVLEDSVGWVNLSSYDYVMSCQGRIAGLLTEKFDFKRTYSYAEGTFELYENQRPTPAVAAANEVFKLGSLQSAGDKYEFVSDTMDKDFSFLPEDDNHPAIKLTDAFGNLAPENIHEGFMTASAPAGGQLKLKKDEAVYYQLEGDNLILSAAPTPGMQEVQDKTIDLPPAGELNIAYADPSIKPDNLVLNASLEQGLWQEAVGDCYAYDDDPDLGMKLSSAEKTDGNQALELSARLHIACTGPDNIPVMGGSHYMLSFDYQSPDGGKYAGYYVSFDDPDETVISERMQGDSAAWQTFSRELAVPEGATSMHLMFYAFPDSYGDKTRIARYDRAGLTPIPPAQDRFYIVGQPGADLEKPGKLDYKIENPTRKTVYITDASQPFYLTTSETYNPLWQLELLGARPTIQLPFTPRSTVSDTDHLQLNGTMNAWYIDPAKLCKQGNGCTQNENGSYNFTLVAEFTPQRWFYFGAAISTAALAAGIIYFLYDRRQSKHHKEGRWRWHR
jgi:hypothetical protein